jgi:hypothetical protein
MFPKLDLYPSSGEGRQSPTLLGLLERSNLNLSPHMKMESGPVSETPCFLVIMIPDDGQSPETSWLYYTPPPETCRFYL